MKKETKTCVNPESENKEKRTDEIEFKKEEGVLPDHGWKKTIY